MTEIDQSKPQSGVEGLWSSFDVDQVKVVPESEIGMTGLERQGKWVYEEFLPQLHGEKATKVYREMRDNDPVVGAVIFAIEMLIRQVSWRVEPASKSEADEEAAGFVKSCLDDMSSSWEDTLAEITTMLTYGFAPFEIVYKKRKGLDQETGETRSKYNDNKIGWRKIALRSQDSLWGWEFDENGGIAGMWQQAPPDYQLVFIPIEKMLIFRTAAHKNNPEGRSMLRNAYRPWYFKKRVEELEGIGIERDLAGLPVAYVDPAILQSDASPEKKAMLASIKKMVKNVRRDKQEGIVFPKAYDENGNLLYEFVLMSAAGSRQFSTAEVIQRYDQRIAMTALADFILLGHEAVGSFALSSSKTTLFSVAIGAWLDGISEVFNRYAIPRLLKLNNMKTDALPILMHGDIEKQDLAELGAYITSLAGAGAPLFPDDKLVQYLKETANLPTDNEVGESDEEEEAKPLGSQDQAKQREIAQQNAMARAQQLADQAAQRANPATATPSQPPA